MKCNFYFIITLCTLAFWSISVKSQISQKDFRIGLSGGIEENVGSERIAFGEYVGYLADYKKYNYGIGLDVEYGLKNRITLNASIEYSNNDFTGTYYCDNCDFAVPPEPEDVKFSFIGVPITLKYYFWKNRIHPFVEAGLNNLFALDQFGHEARTNRYTVGIKIGGGLEYSLSQKIGVQLKVDYNNTLSNLFEDPYYENPNFKLKTLNVGVGLIKKI